MFQYHKQLRSFYAVARHGGFTAAARQLHVGQPTVTAQVRQLEDCFGVELFFRKGKTVRLSPTGEELYTVAKGLFAHEEEAMRLLPVLRDKPAGLLRLASVSPPIAVELLNLLGHRFAGMEASMALVTEAEAVTLLQDFAIDVGVLARVPEGAGLYSQLYSSRPIVAVLHRDHPLATRANLSLRELARQTLLLREPGSKTRQIVQQAAAAQGLSLKAHIELNSREAILHAVRAGLGCSFVTDLEFLPIPELCAVPLAQGRLRIDYFLCCHASRAKRPHIAALLALAKRPGPLAR